MQPTKANVLDYGTGSGILAICAAELGASTVVGVDVDEGSVDTWLQNSIDLEMLMTFLGGKGKHNSELLPPFCSKVPLPAKVKTLKFALISEICTYFRVARINFTDEWYFA